MSIKGMSHTSPWKGEVGSRVTDAEGMYSLTPTHQHNTPTATAPSASEVVGQEEGRLEKSVRRKVGFGPGFVVLTAHQGNTIQCDL